MREAPVSAVLLSVFLWSTFPVAAAFATPSIGVVLLTVGAEFIAIVLWLFALWQYGQLSFVRTLVSELAQFKNGLWAIALTTGVASAAERLFFYYAISIGEKTQVTVLYETWPVMSVLLVWLFFPERWKNLTLLRFIMILLAGAAAGVLLWNVTKQQTGPTVADVMALGAYAAALVAAVANAVESVSTPKLADMLKSEDTYSTSISASLVSRVLSLAIIGILYLLNVFPAGWFAFQADWYAFGALVWIGLLVVGCGSVLWVYGIKESLAPSIYALWYVTPIGAIIWLFVFGQGVLTDVVVMSAAVVVFANLYIHSTYRHQLTTSGSLAFFLFISFCVVTLPAHYDERLMQMAQIAGLVLGLLATFTLDRLSKKIGKEREILDHVGTTMLHLYKMSAYLLGDDAARAVKHQIDSVYRRIIEYDFTTHTAQAEDDVRQIYNSLEGLEEVIRAEAQRSEADALEVLNRVDPTFRELRTGVDDWLSLKGDRLSVAENLSLWLLGVSVISIGVAARPEGFFGDLVAAFLTTGIVFILLQIHDFNRNRPDRNFSTLMISQRLVRRLGLDYYLPKWVVDLSRVPVPNQDVTVRVFNPETQQLEPRAIKAETLVFQNISKLVFVATAALLIFMLLEKHFGLFGVIETMGVRLTMLVN